MALMLGHEWQHDIIIISAAWICDVKTDGCPMSAAVGVQFAWRC
jgi:hypothetical protein